MGIGQKRQLDSFLLFILSSTHNSNGMAPATDKSVSEIATNLLVPPVGAFSSRGHSPTTDNSVRVEIHRSASYVVYVRCYAGQTVHNNPRIIWRTEGQGPCHTSIIIFE